MILKIYNDKKELVNTIFDKDFIKDNFLQMLFNKYIAKVNSIKQVQYNFNYSDKQKIVFIHDNKWRSVYEGIPTTWGLLDIQEMNK